MPFGADAVADSEPPGGQARKERQETPAHAPESPQNGSQRPRRASERAAMMGVQAPPCPRAQRSQERLPLVAPTSMPRDTSRACLAMRSSEFGLYTGFPSFRAIPCAHSLTMLGTSRSFPMASVTRCEAISNRPLARSHASRRAGIARSASAILPPASATCRSSSSISLPSWLFSSASSRSLLPSPRPSMSVRTLWPTVTAAG